MRRHRFDPLSFLFGIIFVIIAVGSVSNAQAGGGFNAGRIWSLSVAAAGLTLVVWALMTMIRRSEMPAAAVQDHPSDEPPAPAPEASGVPEDTEDLSGDNDEDEIPP
jgi:hypothetical protein